MTGPQVSFGPSTSANTYVLAQAVRLWLRGQNAAIVVTNQDLSLIHI